MSTDPELVTRASSGRCSGRARAGATTTQAGATLIELVMTIIVVAAAVAGVLSNFNFATARSADPMLQTQSQAVARAYLEEVLLRAYADPDTVEAGENRATFDDVDDYHALAANGCLVTSVACPVLGDCPCDQFGNPIDDLFGYAVAVAVVPATLNGVPALRVDVTVSHATASRARVQISGYRTDH